MSVSLTMVLAIQGMSLSSLPEGTGVISRAHCVSLCYYKKTCSSVFYDRFNKTCQLADSVFTTLDTPSSRVQYLVWNPARTGGTGSCKAGYVYDQTADVCYNVSYVQKTWQLAEDQCVSDDGHLMEVEDDATNNLMIQLSNTIDYSFWIGGNDIGEEGTWVWADGTPVQSDYWGSGALSTGEFSDCMRVKTGSASLINRWSDADCDVNRYFICQVFPVEQDPPPPSNDCQ